jgi:NADH-quinone oxidoreductase subunit E
MPPHIHPDLPRQEVLSMDAENSQLEAMLAGYGPRGRTILLEMLHDAQEIYGGWLPRPAIERIAEFLEIPVADVYGVTQFYEMFHTEPVGRRVIRVCQDGPCAVAGATQLTEQLSAQLGIRPGETTPDGRYTLSVAECLGSCGTAPMMMVNETYHENLTCEQVDRLLEGLA